MSVFLQISADRILYRDHLFFIVRDLYPVSPGHSLIISNAMRADYFALTPTEQQHLPVVLRHCKQLIEQEFTPAGYNIGMNCGDTAGQTVPHFHCTLSRATTGIWQTRAGHPALRSCKGYY